MKKEWSGSAASEVIREALRLLVEREGASIQRRVPEQRRKDVVVEQLCARTTFARRGLSSLALFGSVARGAARPDSDVDVLVDIVPNIRFSLIDRVAVKNFLEDRLGRRVDVVTKEGLDPGVRDRVLRDAIASGRLSGEEGAIRDALAMWERRERARAEILASVDVAEAALARGEGRVSPKNL